MRGSWAGGSYHVLMSAFLAEGVAMVPDGFDRHHVTAVRQERPSEIRPHPAVMRILRDAGVADYAETDIAAPPGSRGSRRPTTRGWSRGAGG